MQIAVWHDSDKTEKCSNFGGHKQHRVRGYRVWAVAVNAAAFSATTPFSLV